MIELESRGRTIIMIAQSLIQSLIVRPLELSHKSEKLKRTIPMHPLSFVGRIE